MCLGVGQSDIADYFGDGEATGEYHLEEYQLASLTCKTRSSLLTFSIQKERLLGKGAEIAIPGSRADQLCMIWNTVKMVIKPMTGMRIIFLDVREQHIIELDSP